jgi:hypothetical protein
LPDGKFSNQKSKFGLVVQGLAMEYVGILYGHLVSLTAVWYILWLFGTFFPIWKNLATLPGKCISQDVAFFCTPHGNKDCFRQSHYSLSRIKKNAAPQFPKPQNMDSSTVLEDKAETLETLETF